MRTTTFSANLSGGNAITLAAATETDVLLTNPAVPDSRGIDVSQSDAVSVVLKNTGSNSIETVTLYQSPLGVNFVAYNASLGPVTAGNAILLQFEQFDVHQIRLTCTSSAGTTVEIEALGTRETL